MKHTSLTGCFLSEGIEPLGGPLYSQRILCLEVDRCCCVRVNWQAIQTLRRARPVEIFSMPEQREEGGCAHEWLEL